MNTKCYGCGLVNKLEAAECGRCGGQLGVRPVETLNPFEGEAPSTFSGLRLLIMLSVAVVGSFAAYQFFKVEVPKPVVKTAEQRERETQMITTMQPGPISTPDPQRSTSDSYRLERDQRDMLKQSFKDYKAPKIQHQPYIPPGSFGPPGAGVPYHTR